MYVPDTRRRAGNAARLTFSPIVIGAKRIWVRVVGLFHELHWSDDAVQKYFISRRTSRPYGAATLAEAWGSALLGAPESDEDKDQSEMGSDIIPLGLGNTNTDWSKCVAVKLQA
jgi:hypothetical protein